MKISATELTSQAYTRVRAMIREEQLLPGQKIVQEKLAAELGISRTPLRAALQLLEGENLVSAIPRRGMFVREYSEEEIQEIYDCRVALEATATRLFAKRGEEAEIEELASIFAPFVGQNEIDTKAYRRADIRFHQLLMDGCKNVFLQRLFKQGNVLICIEMIGLVRPAQETLSEHQGIVEAIRNRDGELAEKLMKQHLISSQSLLTDD